jgi:hypothetical protein
VHMCRFGLVFYVGDGLCKGLLVVGYRVSYIFIDFFDNPIHFHVKVKVNVLSGIKTASH